MSTPTHTSAKTILLTGGAGFIGFHTARALLDRGDTVVMVDDLNDYYDVSLKLARVEELKKHPHAERLTFVVGDVADYAMLEEVYSTHPFTHICHLAAQAGVRYSLEQPFSYERANLLGFLNILELARHKQITNLIYASSSSVYGANTKTPFAETDMTDRPVSLYAATKKANELMAHAYHHLYGINCTGLRFFTVYGPWGRPDMAPMGFAKKMCAGEPIDIYNGGDMKRDFTYIDDIVAGVVSAIDHSYAWEVFNLAYGRSVPLLAYIEALERALGVTAVRTLLPMQPGDVPVTDADISHAKEKLGYDPATSVTEGVATFAQWYRQYYAV